MEGLLCPRDKSDLIQRESRRRPRKENDGEIRREERERR